MYCSSHSIFYRRALIKYWHTIKLWFRGIRVRFVLIRSIWLLFSIDWIYISHVSQTEWNLVEKNMIRWPMLWCLNSFSTIDKMYLLRNSVAQTISRLWCVLWGWDVFSWRHTLVRIWSNRCIDPHVVHQIARHFIGRRIDVKRII